ncbi:unnamed protein product [Heligmosomoides polygyrus]|uniref:Uncharacterized protein n=1 Tax=Heligmosomoides polygyrus TaxID=6339 RepID=A0A183FAS7_HELPZ|nr:unnamed protein product [Heligmosomoides polygyrus]
MPPRFASPDATPSTNGNYHSRTTPVFKSYKYTQKLSQRPRLRIRHARETGYRLSTGSQQQHHHHQPQLYRSSEVPTAPVAVMPPRFASPDATPSTNGNYHSRTTPVFKSYKYTQKLSQRPRLRIRRPGRNTRDVIVGNRKTSILAPLQKFFAII